MTIKEFEMKYDISFEGCFVYDGLFRIKALLESLPTEIESNGKINRVDFINDFLDLTLV